MYNNLIGRTITTYGTGGGTTTARFVYDGQNMILAFNGSGSLTDRYLFGPAIDEVLADEKITSTNSTGATLWALADNEGTIRDVIHADSSLDDHFTYNAFGKMLSGGSSQDFLFGYTGTYTGQINGTGLIIENAGDAGKVGVEADKRGLGSGTGRILARCVGVRITICLTPTAISCRAPTAMAR
jgi:hypothetical protein